MNSLYQIYLQHPQVFIDTRKELTDGLFFAVGQKDANGLHRGNQFAEMALESGKAAYVVINDASLKSKYADDERFILVEDCEKSLQDLARIHRKNLRMPIIAIAGSNGKTTTKELLDRVLSLKYITFSTRGNLNNHLGVPLSILSIDSSGEYEMVILEIGANHLDETRFLAEIIAPDYGLVTNCGKDHLGEYGSIENIIKGNKELYDVLSETDKTAFVSNNDKLLREISVHIKKRIFYGAYSECNAEIKKRYLQINVESKNNTINFLDHFSDNLSENPLLQSEQENKEHLTNKTEKIDANPFLQIRLYRQGQFVDIQTHLFGSFWLDTLLGVAAVGQHFGVSLEQIKLAFESYKPASLRSQLIIWEGNKVLLDCYNANPSSMEAFLNAVYECNLSEPKILILGEMLELGEYSQEEHQKIVDSLDFMKVEEVILVGNEFLEVKTVPRTFELIRVLDKETVKEYLKEKNYEGHFIFVKGSRGNRLEAIFE